MYRTLIVSVLFLSMFSMCNSQTFKEQQQKNSRVKESYSSHGVALQNLLQKNNLSIQNLRIFIRIFKEEDAIEIWAKQSQDSLWRLINTIDVCAKSGELGPKRREGDGQVPEGFYHISHFNPNSNFYLSLKVSYPNESDRILGYKSKLGGDIYIHGHCVTIGCVPLQEEIRLLYLLCVEAKNAGQEKIEVHIFPWKMQNQTYNDKKNTTGKTNLFAFWDNLKTGYEYFEQNKKLPKIKVDKTGKYSFRY